VSRGVRRPPERDESFTQLSGDPVAPLDTEPICPIHGPLDRAGRSTAFRAGVRRCTAAGVDDSQFCGLRDGRGDQTSASTTARPRSTGLSDGPSTMPSLMGLDSITRARGDVGRGVAIASLDDMQTLFCGSSLGDSRSYDDSTRRRRSCSRSTSLRRGGGRRAAGALGTIQRTSSGVDRPEGLVLPCRPGDAPGRGHDRVVLEPRMPAGPRSRSRATTPLGRLDGRPGAGVTLNDADLFEQAVARGLDVAISRPRLSSSSNAQIDFFEDRQLRAARRILARELRETFGARDPKSWHYHSTRRPPLHRDPTSRSR